MPISKKALLRPSASSTPSSDPTPKVTKPGSRLRGKAKILSSKTVYKGRVFSVTADQVEEPGGVSARRDVIRHNGSVVILAVDHSRNRKDPDILLIRQYRYAAGQFLLELPAGRIEPGEKLIPAARRELIEETGYRAKKWSHHIRYFASPGFLSEAMNVLLAEDLTLGTATPEDDERIEILMTPLSEVLRMIHAGKILDGKTTCPCSSMKHKDTSGARAKRTRSIFVHPPGSFVGPKGDAPLGLWPSSTRATWPAAFGKFHQSRRSRG